MGKGRKPQSQLIGSHPMSAGAIGKQIQLLLFDAVFHVTPGAIKLLVQPALQAQITDKKSGSMSLKLSGS
jgi:hypothetical protein